MDLVIIGGNSGIFKLIAPDLINHFNTIYIGTRSKPTHNIEYAKNFKLDFAINSLSAIFKQLNNPVLVINFLGFFGKMKDFFDYDPKEIIENIDKNLVPFLSIHQSAKYLPSNSLIINFSGSGVGGNNLEISNLAYTSSKILISNLIESLNQILIPYNVNTCAISPGPFPTNMQLEILKQKHSKSDKHLILKTEKMFDTKVDTKDLVNLIYFLNGHRKLVGGRVWSAKWDKSFQNYSNFLGKHGLFRRITLSSD